MQYAMNSYNYLYAHGGDLLRDVSSMPAEVQWQVLADFARALFKTNGICIATSAERGTYNILNNLSEDVVSVDRLKEKSGKDNGEGTDFLEDEPDTAHSVQHLDATSARARRP